MFYISAWGSPCHPYLESTIVLSDKCDHRVLESRHSARDSIMTYYFILSKHYWPTNSMHFSIGENISCEIASAVLFSHLVSLSIKTPVYI